MGELDTVNMQKSTQRYTLQQLADAADMTVRNVRSYQTRGLIPPPARQGRQSVYSDEHLARLREIRQARARGATLSLIGHRLSTGGSLDAESIDRAWLPLRNGARSTGAAGNGSAASRSASLDGVLARASASADEVSAAVDELVEAGVLRRSGRRVVADRALATGVGSLAKRGLPVERALDVAKAAAEAGRTLGAAMEAALAEVSENDRARLELLDLVAGVLSTVVTLDLRAAEAADARAANSTHDADQLPHH